MCGCKVTEVDVEELPRLSTNSTLRQRRNEDDRVDNRTERSATASSFHEAKDAHEMMCFWMILLEI